jgi:molecular chaperone DnaJ
MPQKKDYYQILGVDRNAPESEIKSAFRNLAKKFHPDVYEGDRKFAEEKFKEISEAYEVLLDPQKRATYDEFGTTGVESRFGKGHFEWGDFTHFGDLEDIFGRGFGDDLFSRLFGVQGGGQRRYGPQRGDDLRMDVRVELKSVLEGSNEYVRVRRALRCPFCRGSGARKPEDVVACTKCGGTGQVRNVQTRGFASFITISTCPECRGNGKIIGRPCLDCKGAGMTEKLQTISITIPRGIEEGSRLRVSGAGNEDRSTGLSGDLYIVIHIKEHRDFDRYGNDLIHRVEVSYATAALGGSIAVPLLDGTKQEVRVPAGTQPGDVITLRGKGLPSIEGAVGDLQIKVHVAVPTSVSREERELLIQLDRMQKEKSSVMGRVKGRLFKRDEQ